jgi:hypothetical protein
MIERETRRNVTAFCRDDTQTAQALPTSSDTFAQRSKMENSAGQGSTLTLAATFRQIAQDRRLQMPTGIPTTRCR